MQTTDPLVSWRHRLHRIPETAFDEHRTSDFIAGTLREVGLEVTTGIGGTGVVGTLRRGTGTGTGTPHRAIGLRADMDALPLHEETGLPYASEHPGAMHACGHDGHMTMVLGAAATLARDGGFDGTLHVVFQPAEEPGRGAAAMIDDGLFDRFPMDAMFGLHNLPGIPAGHLLTREGPIMAGEDNFTIRITGRGGHASSPHLVVDPLVTAAHVIVALQTIVARVTDPLAAAVVSCTDIVTDGARNAIPSLVTITGDTRTFADDDSALLEERIRRIAELTARAHGAVADVAYTREFRPTRNDAAPTAAALRAATTIGAPTAVCEPIMASEDFGLYADHVPANFTFIGNGATGQTGGVPLHSHDYDVNDAILPIGVAYYTRLVRDLLPE